MCITVKGEVLKRIENGEIGIVGCFDCMWCVQFEGQTVYLSDKGHPDKKSVVRSLVSMSLEDFRKFMVNNEPYARAKLEND